MTNETARREIESLDYYLQNHTDDYSEESHTAMMMAVKVLDQEPCRYWQNGKCNGNTEVCEDAISRQAVLDIVNNPLNIRLDEIIKKLPPVTLHSKTGHWIRQDNTKKPLYGWYFCSECNSVIGDKPKFCSNCGARMEDKA